MQNLDKIMKPKSIAVVGASTKEHTIGSDIMKRLQEYKFNGNIYPVNPKGGIIEGFEYDTVVGWLTEDEVREYIKELNTFDLKTLAPIEII